ncbi:MAG TPA: TcpQ domain-containing protein [Scandinavium sp.]
MQDLYARTSPEVVRYDRYMLVNTRPGDAQQDPLSQMVDVHMPAQLIKTVGDGLRYLLLESGYSLCSSDASAGSALFTKTLPAVQRSVGPVRLSDALQLLAGPAWRMHVDDVNREVCFVLRDGLRNFSPKPAISPLTASARVPTVQVANPPRFLPALGNSPLPSPKIPSLPAVAPVVSPQQTPVSAATSRPAAIHPTSHSVVPSTAPLLSPLSVRKPVFSAPAGSLWQAQPGSTLKETLNHWAADASCESGGHWLVIWPVQLDYRIDAPLSLRGSFESVLVQLFDLYRDAQRPLYASASRFQCLVSVSDSPVPGQH